jgi:hypothetical protein
MNAKTASSGRVRGGLLVSAAVLLAAMAGLAAACNAAPAASSSSSASSQASSTTVTAPPTTASPMTTVPPGTAASTIGDTAAQSGAVIQKVMTGWGAKDAAVLSPLYAAAYKGYDAYFPGETMDKQAADGMLQDPSWWKNFDVQPKTYFVSADGKFAAMTAVATIPSLGLQKVPGGSLYALVNGQVTFSFDYYGGAPSQTAPAPDFPQTTIDPGSSEAKTARADATATLKKWVAAYDGRDAEAFLASYAESATYVDLVAPAWRVLTKSELAADVASHFPRAEFKSSLGPAPAATSPLVDGFFVSADGRYAAAQGSYMDTGMSAAQPMLILLKMEAGKIVAQYNYMLTAGGALQQ